MNFVLGIAAMLGNGFALQHIWAWSIVPVFAGLPHINFWQAVGINQLSLWIPIFVPQDEFEKRESDQQTVSLRHCFSLIRAGLAMGVSWFAHWMQS